MLPSKPRLDLNIWSHRKTIGGGTNAFPAEHAQDDHAFDEHSRKVLLGGKWSQNLIKANFQKKAKKEKMIFTIWKLEMPMQLKMVQHSLKPKGGGVTSQSHE